MEAVRETTTLMESRLLIGLSRLQRSPVEIIAKNKPEVNRENRGLEMSMVDFVF